MLWKYKFKYELPFTIKMHPRLSKNDPGSYSNPGNHMSTIHSLPRYYLKKISISEDVIISHMDLFLDVDFMVETLAGSVFLTAERKSPKADKLVRNWDFYRPIYTYLFWN